MTQKGGLAFARFGSMLSKKSVFANEQFLPEALMRSSENYVGGHLINPIPTSSLHKLYMKRWIAKYRFRRNSSVSSFFEF